jgi:hypothetical protein
MNEKVCGKRPRPRVALLGKFASKELERFQKMFPTIWRANYSGGLGQLVDPREIDLIIIAPDIVDAGKYPENAHVICFSTSIPDLPGLRSENYVYIRGKAKTEEFILPDVPLSLSRLRTVDFRTVTSVRGWPTLGLAGVVSDEEDLCKSAIVSEAKTNEPLACVYWRSEVNLGVAWLPQDMPIDRPAWVELLVQLWSQLDSERLPNFGDWTRSPEWMVPEEESILAQIAEREAEKQKVIAEIDQHIAQLTSGLASTTVAANTGRRRLITAQGDELVEEVKNVFEAIGFKVELVDTTLDPKLPKREDLRLQDTKGADKSWEAIVEVRGYQRSSGNTADLQRIHRFANLYEKEKGKLPSKSIYIVNGQIELLPNQRQEPFASAQEDLNIFAESNGLVIWTIDLFRAIKSKPTSEYRALIKSLKKATGRWIPE